MKFNKKLHKTSFVVLLGLTLFACKKDGNIPDDSTHQYTIPSLTSNKWKLDSVVFLSQSNIDSVYYSSTNVPSFSNTSFDFSLVWNGNTVYQFHDSTNTSLRGPSSSNYVNGDTTIFRYNSGLWGVDNITSPTLLTCYDSTKAIKRFSWTIDTYTSDSIKAHYTDSSIVKLSNSDTTIYYHYNKRVALSKR